MPAYVYTETDLCFVLNASAEYAEGMLYAGPWRRHREDPMDHGQETDKKSKTLLWQMKGGGVSEGLYKEVTFDENLKGGVSEQSARKSYQTRW